MRTDTRPAALASSLLKFLMSRNVTPVSSAILWTRSSAPGSLRCSGRPPLPLWVRWTDREAQLVSGTFIGSQGIQVAEVNPYSPPPVADAVDPADLVHVRTSKLRGAGHRVGEILLAGVNQNVHCRRRFVIGRAALATEHATA